MSGSYDVEVLALVADSLTVNQNNGRTTIRGDLDTSVHSITIDESGALYVTGRASSANLVFKGKENDAELTAQLQDDNAFLYFAGLDSLLNWSWVRKSAAPSPEEIHQSFGRWNGIALVVMGTFRLGDFVLVQGDDRAILSTDTAYKSFYTATDRSGTISATATLSIESEFGDPAHFTPIPGPFADRQITDRIARTASALVPVGSIVEVSSPKAIYKLASGTIISDVDITEAQIENEAITRYVSNGYSVEGEATGDDDNVFTFTINDNITIKFNWRVEHAVTIRSAAKDSVANGGLGLGDSSEALGNPFPVVKKHWIAENELFTAFIDGAALDPDEFGRRFVVSGYEAEGAAKSTPAAALGTPELIEFDFQQRQQISQFAVTGPAVVKYQWKIQNRIRVDTSITAAHSLPFVRPQHDPDDLNASSAQTAMEQAGVGWFDTGTVLLVGAPKTGLGLSLSNDGILATLGDLEDIQRKQDLGDPIGGDFSKEITLTQNTEIVWDYSNQIYRDAVSIGQAVSLTADAETSAAGALPRADLLTQPVIDSIDLNIAPAVRVLEGPPGSAAVDMQVWDEVTNQSYPLRPGRFLLEWQQKGGNPANVVLLEITSGFPGDDVIFDDKDTMVDFSGARRDYRNLSAPNLPPVDLDPDADDDVFFLSLAYSEAGGSVVANGQLKVAFESKEDRAVLVFSRSLSGPAQGDLTRERLFVKIVETRKWDSNSIEPEESGPWDDSGGSMIESVTPNAPIGQKLASAAFDLANIGTGFVVTSHAPINPNIYDGGKVAEAGPIIPVNITVGTAERDQLMVVWYERMESIFWPWQSAHHTPAWPTRSYLTVDPNNSAAIQPIDRIVIASRVGSEGRNDTATDNDQHVFSPDRYDDVVIYNQPNRELRGFNPNEEHALMAPSFRFLNEANPPSAAFALRDDLNVTDQNSASYTSEPYVLVQFFDEETGEDGEHGMNVYKIVREDASKYTAANPFIDPNDPLEREFPYEFNYPMEAGEPVQPPYPLSTVIGLTPCQESRGRGQTSKRTYWEDHRGQAWAVSDGNLYSIFYYPLPVNFWHGETDHNVVPLIQPGECLPFLPVNGPLGATEIQYRATWPEVLPILKVGETLTFAGGEYARDVPTTDILNSSNEVVRSIDTPGLPGVVGWASGKTVYDSMNPSMDNQSAFTNYSARLIAPLETVKVRFTDLGEAQAAALQAAIEPRPGGVTRVDGRVWRFEDLPASLGKRVAYDPLTKELTFKGFLNDKTLGDETLTAPPPPVYVLEPNIMTVREKDLMLGIADLRTNANWSAIVERLFQRSRNPNGLSQGGNQDPENPYYVGLESDRLQLNNQDREDENGVVTPIPNSARPANALGPGLALVPSPQLLEPGSPDTTGYITLVENDDPEIGGAVTVHIVKVVKKHRYRGAVKTILSDNIFDEKITVRHTGDFGGNGDDIVYQWFYREEDGTEAPLPPADPWKLFPDQSSASPKGLGMFQINLEGTGGLILADNQLFVRYRHKDDNPTDDNNSVNWQLGTEWERDGQPEAGRVIGELWAGAGNSPTVDGEYRPQLAIGWIKRVVDRINPFEARFDDFRNNESPATYVSMIRQAGRLFEGPVALNPDKDVIENVGLIELYRTILDRGAALSIDLESPITTPGINNALLLAATRISDLFMLLGNEAYADALDPTIGFESGSAHTALFTFQNQLPSLLDEELAMLRGISDSYGTPVFNRLFPNLTKTGGEVAYAVNYNLSDQNNDGFVDETDALIQLPTGSW